MPCLIHLKHHGDAQVSESLRRWGDSRKNCCSWREYFKLTAWTLVEFEAVILLDSDQLAIGDLSSAFLCAQGGAGRLLYTSGPLSPLNAGFLALRTSYQLFQDMERVISQVILPLPSHTNSWMPRLVSSLSRAL